MERALIVVGYKTINYGSAIQAVATQRLFEKKGLEVEIMNLDGLWSVFKRKKMMFYITDVQLIYLLKSKGKMILSKTFCKIDNDYRKLYDARVEKFACFFSDQLKLSSVVNNLEEARELVKCFNYAIIGSDQVWLPSSVITDIYNLSFAWDINDLKTISYAPSFGIEYIWPKYRLAYKKMLENIDCISVRENNGVKIVEEIIEKTPTMVADPVLMFTEDEWEEIIPSRTVPEEKYAFVYFIGNNKSHRKKVIEYTRKRGLNTVALIHLDEYIKEDEKIYDKYYIDLSPEDFVNYVRNADIVFTDSYHCFLLSLIHKKAVGLFMRFRDNNKVSTNNRLYSIIERLGIDTGVIDDGMPIIDENIIHEYDQITKNIEDYRMLSYGFVEDAIKGY